MNKFFGMICLTAVFTAMGSSAFADSPQMRREKQQKNEKQMEMFAEGEMLPKDKYPAAYNAPAAVKTNNWDCCTLNVNAAFIYWHVSQESMDVAYVDPTVVLGFTDDRAVAFQDFDYKPGFKVGLGISSNFDGWAGNVEYTRLHETTTTHKTAPLVAGMQVYNTPDWFANVFTTANAVPKVHSHWRFHFDMVDAVMSRPFYQGRRVTVTPYGGLRGLWIDQQLRVEFEETATIAESTSLNKSDSWAVGPKMGACAHWMLGGGVRLQGNAAASILYTRYTEISHKESGRLVVDGAPDGTVTNVGGEIDDFNALRPIIDMGLGLGWGHYFANQKVFIDLSIDYEFMYLWDQNVMRELVSTLQNRVDHVGDLQIHGVTGRLGFYF